MKVPYIEYSGPDNDSNLAFSLLYDRDYIKAFLKIMITALMIS